MFWVFRLTRIVCTILVLKTVLSMSSADDSCSRETLSQNSYYNNQTVTTCNGILRKNRIPILSLPGLLSLKEFLPCFVARLQREEFLLHLFACTFHCWRMAFFWELPLLFYSILKDANAEWRELRELIRAKCPRSFTLSCWHWIGLPVQTGCQVLCHDLWRMLRV